MRVQLIWLDHDGCNSSTNVQMPVCFCIRHVLGRSHARWENRHILSSFANRANQRAGLSISLPHKSPCRVWTQKMYPLLAGVHAQEFLSRCRYSTPTPRHLMAEIVVHPSSHFSLRKSQEKCTPAETPSHKTTRAPEIVT